MERATLCDFCHDDGRRELAVGTEVTVTGMEIDLCGDHLDMVLSARIRLGLPSKALLPVPLDDEPLMPDRGIANRVH